MSQLIKPKGKHLTNEVKIHRHQHVHESPAQTEGRMIRWHHFTMDLQTS
jgi:hypothetical protein